MYLKKVNFKMILLLIIALNFIFIYGFSEEINSNLPVKSVRSAWG